jgi:dihydroorotate dehydrogenase (fumarate)
MANLKTNYLGIELRNPIIIGASNLVADNDNLKRMEDAGAAAIVYKSLFEEQIQLERAQLDNELEAYTERNAEMTTLFPHIEHAGPKEHLYNLEKAKKSISIPLIASLNAIFKETWVDYAKQIEQTGVDALELNFYAIPKDDDITGESIEKQQIAILKEIKKVVKIPVSVKLSPFYSNTINFVKELDKNGADGLVLFNRFYQPDLDISENKHIATHSLSNENENKLPMKFAGLLYAHIAAGICANSGIHQGSDVIKMILAGADTVQVVSTVYQNKFGQIEKMLKDIEAWMDSKNYNTLQAFRGLLSKKNTNDPFVYQRAQYIDLLLRSGELFNHDSLR